MNNNNKHKECIGCGAKFKGTAANTKCKMCKTPNKDKGGIEVRENTLFEANEIKQYIKLNGVVKC